MISKFVTVYPGHIDLPDMGQDATPANERRYSNEQLASVFDKTEAVAKTMDALGFDTLWLAEHHFQHACPRRERNRRRERVGPLRRWFDTQRNHQALPSARARAPCASSLAAYLPECA